MHIGEFAERAGLSQRTIRHYDEVGLLKPSARTEGGFRLYTTDDLDRMLLIRRMKPLGFSLDEMGDLLQTADALRADTANEDARQRLAAFLGEAQGRRERLAAQLSMADEFIRLLQER